MIIVLLFAIFYINPLFFNFSIIANSSGVASGCNEFPGVVLYSCFHLVNVSITSVETCKSRSVMSSKVQSEEELSPKFLVMVMLEITYSFFFFTKYPFPAIILSFFSKGSLFPICSIFSLTISSVAFGK